MSSTANAQAGSSSDVSSSPNANSKTRTVSVAIIGSGGVGKSCLTLQWVKSEFVVVHDPTLEDSYEKQCRIEGELVKVCVADTAGQEEYRVLQEQHIRGCEAVMIAFSLVDEESFDEAITMYQRVCEVKETPNFPVVICANKCDLEVQLTEEKVNEKLRAAGVNFTLFFTSARMKTNVDQSFLAAANNGLKVVKGKGDVGSSEMQVHVEGIGDSKPSQKCSCLIL